LSAARPIDGSKVGRGALSHRGVGGAAHLPRRFDRERGSHSFGFEITAFSLYLVRAGEAAIENGPAGRMGWGTLDRDHHPKGPGGEGLSALSIRSERGRFIIGRPHVTKELRARRAVTRAFRPGVFALFQHGGAGRDMFVRKYWTERQSFPRVVPRRARRVGGGESRMPGNRVSLPALFIVGKTTNRAGAPPGNAWAMAEICPVGFYDNRCQRGTEGPSHKKPRFLEETMEAGLGTMEECCARTIARR